MKAMNKETNLVKALAVPAGCKVACTEERPFAAFCGTLHGDALRSAARKLRERELLAFLGDEDAPLAARIASVAALDDVALLVAVACAEAPALIRRDALQRLDEVRDGNPLGDGVCRLLVPCLDEKELVAYTVVLMDESGYDWCASCAEGVAHVLCEAMSGCASIHEAILLEDAYAQLAHSRPDMRADLQACVPESFIPRTVYTPMIASGPLLVDNVA